MDSLFQEIDKCKPLSDVEDNDDVSSSLGRNDSQDTYKHNLEDEDIIYNECSRIVHHENSNSIINIDYIDNNSDNEQSSSADEINYEVDKSDIYELKNLLEYMKSNTLNSFSFSFDNNKTLPELSNSESNVEDDSNIIINKIINISKLKNKNYDTNGGSTIANEIENIRTPKTSIHARNCNSLDKNGITSYQDDTYRSQLVVDEITAKETKYCTPTQDSPNTRIFFLNDSDCPPAPRRRSNAPSDFFDSTTKSPIFLLDFLYM